MDKMPQKSSFRLFLERLFPPRQTRSLDENEETASVTISRPDIPFRVLDAFSRQGLFFIDLESGEYVDGLIDLPSIGLSFTAPEVIGKCTNLGFLGLSSKNPKNVDPDEFELDAVLFFEYDGPECKTGFLAKEIAYLYYLKVWSDLDLCRWEEIVANVVKDLTVTDGDVTHSFVKFVISTTFIPNDKLKQSKLVIPKSAISESASAISGQTIVPEEDDEYENSHQKRPRS